MPQIPNQLDEQDGQFLEQFMLARERHLAHLSESVLDEYAEDAERRWAFETQPQLVRPMTANSGRGLEG